MRKKLGKIIWIQVSLQARDCRLHRSKRGSDCCCGTVKTGKVSCGTPGTYISISIYP